MKNNEQMKSFFDQLNDELNKPPIEISELSPEQKEHFESVFNSLPTHYEGPALKMLFVGSQEDYNNLSQEMKNRFEPYGTL